MSQYPPPGFNPPPGSPPMGMPPQGYPPAGGPRLSNGSAIASLIFGILGCIPFTGVLAVPLGIAGIKKTKNPQVGGKGLAIAGLILGLINLAVYIPGSIFMYTGYKASLASRPPAEQFLKDMSDGKLDAAVADSTGISKADLETLNNGTFKNWGAYQSVNWAFSFKMDAKADASGTQTISTLVGTGTFANGTHLVTFVMEKQGDTWKVKGFQGDKPGTSP
jgi:hypothetical protein